MPIKANTPAQHGIIKGLRWELLQKLPELTDSEGTQLEIQEAETTLAIHAEEFCDELSWEAFSTTKEELHLISEAGLDVDQITQLWMAQVKNFNETFYDDEDDPDSEEYKKSFIRGLLKETFERVSPRLWINKKIRYENQFRHGYVKRFGHLLLENLSARHPEFSDNYKKIIDGLIQKTNSSIQDIVQNLKVRVNYVKDSHPFYTRVFDLCSAFDFEFYPHDLEDILSVMRNASEGLNLTDPGKWGHLSLADLDKKNIWKKWLNEKIERMFIFSDKVDGLTKTSFLDLVFKKINKENNSIGKFGVISGLMQFLLGNLNIDIIKYIDSKNNGKENQADEDLKLYFGRMIQLSLSAVMSEKSDITSFVKQRINLDFFKKVISETFSGKPTAQNSYLNKFYKLVNKMLEKINNKTLNKGDALDSIMNAVHDLLFSAADPSLPYEQQTFFIQDLLIEQLGMDTPDEPYLFYNLYQNQGLSIIMNEVVQRFTQRFTADSYDVFFREKDQFLNIKRKQDLENVTKVQNDLYALSLKINDFEARIDLTDNIPSGLREALDEHFAPRRAKLALIFTDRAIAPKEVEQAKEGIKEDQQEFLRKNKTYQQAPENKKTMIKHLFTYIMKKIREIFDRHKPMTEPRMDTGVHKKNKTADAKRRTPISTTSTQEKAANVMGISSHLISVH